MDRQDDLSPSDRSALLACVLELKRRCPRGRFPLRVHAGRPGGASESFELEPGDRLDPALRTDVAAALLHRARGRVAAPWLWITRPGPPGTVDADLAWSAAARAALAEAAPTDGSGDGSEDMLPEPAGRFVVVTRQGWYEPVTGHGQRWARLRDRS